MNGMVYWQGEVLPVLKLARHYRFMAKVNPRSAAFWRTLCRTAIRYYREQAQAAQAVAA